MQVKFSKARGPLKRSKGTMTLKSHGYTHRLQLNILSPLYLGKCRTFRISETEVKEIYDLIIYALEERGYKIEDSFYKEKGFKKYGS